MSRQVRRWIERGLFVVGFLSAGLWLRDYRKAHVFQSVTSTRLETALHRNLQEGLPDSERIDLIATDGEGSMSSLGRIEIPRLGISAMIAEGTEPEVLDRAVGHVASTSLPGSPGNVGLAGHRGSFFRGLGGIRANDLIRIVTPEATYTYRVEWSEIVEPRRVDVLDSTATPSITLVTCFPFHWIGPAPKRFVVRAVSAETAAPVGPQPAEYGRSTRVVGARSGAPDWERHVPVAGAAHFETRSRRV